MRGPSTQALEEPHTVRGKSDRICRKPPDLKGRGNAAHWCDTAPTDCTVKSFTDDRRNQQRSMACTLIRGLLALPCMMNDPSLPLQGLIHPYGHLEKECVQGLGERSSTELQNLRRQLVRPRRFPTNGSQHGLLKMDAGR